MKSDRKSAELASENTRASGAFYTKKPDNGIFYDAKNTATALCDRLQLKNYEITACTKDIPAYAHPARCAEISIGGAVAGEAGADFLCYVTPSEHLSLPNIDDVREGVVVTKIAAHAADIARGNKRAIERDKKMAIARRNLDWEIQMQCALDPVKARRIRGENPPGEKDVCTMCGKFCAIKQVREYFNS